MVQKPQEQELSVLSTAIFIAFGNCVWHREGASYTLLALMNNFLKELNLLYVDDVHVNKDKSVK